MSKSWLRKEISAKRAALDEQTVIQNSQAIAENLFAIKEFQQARDILFFLSLEKEVQTGGMIGRSFQLGKNVYVPIVDKKEHLLKITKLSGLEIEFEAGAYGIREPGREYLKIVSPTLIDFVVAPGLVFDLKGNRIGFGGGYYDRLLSELSPRATCAGVAFSFQVLESIPQTENDMKVQKIITEKKTINC